MAAVIGALRAVMSLDSAAFQQGITAAQKQLAQFQKQTRKIGSQMQSVGRSMSIGVTAPVAALGAASKMSLDRMRELKNQADLAGETAENFKIMSIAADEVGIARDKLADILKDVNDKLGDFSATGAGPLADFFENIAPKVDLTLESFQNLSSSDALRLYVKALEDAGVSQSEMVFYMEAMASDATSLLPVFSKNGEVLDEVGTKARELGLTIDDELLARAGEIDREFRIVREVLGVELQEALISLGPAFADLGKVMIPVVQDVAEFVAGLAEKFREMDPATQKFIIAATGIAAALGPVAIGLGVLVSGFGLVAGAFSALAGVLLANPIGLTLAAVAVAGFLIWQNWDGIKDFFVDLWTTVSASATEAWEAIRTAWVDGKAALVGAVQEAWAAVLAEVASWPGEFLQLGRDIVQGLVDGILERWDALKSTVTGVGSRMIDSIKGVFDSHSPSRVFMAIGRDLMEGLGIGVSENADMAIDAVTGVGAQMSDLGSGLSSLAGEAASGFSAIVRGAEEANDVIARLLDRLGDRLLTSAFDGIFGSLFGGIGGAFASGGVFAAGRVVPFATGGVVNGPQMFPMAAGQVGLMGESGPEAILPLTRVNGRLGVQAAGGGGGDTWNIDARGADVAAVARLEAWAAQMESGFEGRVHRVNRTAHNRRSDRAWR